jgi:Threonine dehydrogenase and related Zn-dependent dehydrogenases
MDDMMKVIAIVGEKKTELKQVRKPVPGPHQILMQIKACALCTWEQRAYTGESHMPLPFVGGHEIAGIIDSIGSEVNPKEFPVGRKVVARLIHVCGKCYYCRHGEENLCVELNNLDGSQMEIPGTGGLGQYLNVDDSQVYFVPQELPYEKAVFCEPLACVTNSIERGSIELGDDVVVIGGGIMGMLHVLCAKLKGARVIMSEPDETRRKLALELGADIAFSPIEKAPVEFIKSLTEGRGADIVFNTTPIATVAQQAVDMTGPLGRCVMYSSMHPDKPMSISPNWMHKTEAVITGAVSPSVRSFNRSVSLISKGLINPEKLVSGVYDYTDADAAFKAAIRPDTFRIVVKF